MRTEHVISNSDSTKLFSVRTHHQKIVIGPEDTNRGSRVGGRPPRSVSLAGPTCPRCRGAVRYQLTLNGEVLGDDVARGKALSMLTCRHFPCLQMSQWFVAPAPIVFVVHDDEPRAEAKSLADSATHGRRLLARPPVADALDPSYLRPTTETKVGGKPGFITSRGDMMAEEVESEGLGFLFQWSEDIYPRGMKVGSFSFAFGVAYVFSKIDPATKLPVLEDLRAVWQNT